MKPHLAATLTLVASLALLLAVSTAAQGPQSMNAAAVALGQPGLSFRYLQTFGTVEVAYFDDATHLNGPNGVGTDGTNVWIAECEGDRVLKYSSGGAFVMQIGKAGFRYGVSGTSLECLSDVAVDASGNIWVVDQGAHHVVKLNSSGSRVSELGATFSSGTANDRFENPSSIAFDSAGNIYVSDTNNHRVQVFSSSGTYAATLGVTGVSASDNAHFSSPGHIAVDSSNLLYVADANNHRVQVFNVSNLSAIAYVATLGVSGASGSDNAHLNSPQGVAVDVARGRIFVADANNRRVQVFDYTTRAYSSTLSGFSYTADVAVDSAGNLYVAEPWSNPTRVQQFNSNLVYVRTYGTTNVPYLTDDYHFFQPAGVAVAPDGSIYIGESRGRRLIKLNAAGVPQWIKGEPGIWGSDNNHFTYVEDVALDSAGRVYAVDPANCRVQIYNSDGSYHATLGTGCGSGNAQLNRPYGVAIGPGNSIYVADFSNHRVQIYDSNRVYVATIGQTGVTGSDNAHLNGPRDVEVDLAGNIYVADLNNHRVQVFNSSRAYVRTIGETGVSGNDFDHLGNPIAITVDASGRIYVADQWGWRVQVFDNSGAYLTTVGGSGGNRTGQMNQVEGLAIDSAGNLYTAELLNHRIQKFAPGVPGWLQTNLNGFGDLANGNIHTLASFGGQLYAGTYNGAGNGAQLWRMSAGNTWTQPITAGFGVTRNVGLNHLITFDNQLYAGVRNDRAGASIYRSNDGNTWETVATSGFTDTLTAAVYRFAVFNGQIYAGTGIFTNTHGAEIWRSPNGDAGTWTLVVGNGFGNRNNYIMRTSEVHNGYLYFGTQNVDTSTYMTTTGGIIIRSNTGDSGSWTKVTPDGFGDINNYTISGLASFGGYLYASTSSWDVSGIQVWRCQTCDTPGSWQKVVDNGFGNPYNMGISTLQVFDGKLYLVIGNWLTGMEVWRTSTGNSGEWTQISSGGFGDSNNTSPYFNNVTIFNNRLYIGTNNNANGGEVWLYLHRQVYLPVVLRN